MNIEDIQTRIFAITCYTKKFFNSAMRGKTELNNNNMENLNDLKKKLEKVEKLSETKRGNGGYGSTGK